MWSGASHSEFAHACPSIMAMPMAMLTALKVSSSTLRNWRRERLCHCVCAATENVHSINRTGRRVGVDAPGMWFCIRLSLPYLAITVLQVVLAFFLIVLQQDRLRVRGVVRLVDTWPLLLARARQAFHFWFDSIY